MHAREPHTNFIPTTKIIMQALAPRSLLLARSALAATKLNFTFLRFPLSQRSIFYKMILASKAQMVTTTCIIFNPEDFLELLLLLTPIKTKENQSVIKIQR